MIEVLDLIKNYQNKGVETNVIRGISFSIKEGEFVSIMGPSGAGKSTLLYQVSLLDKPTSGKIIIDNKDVTKFDNGEASEFRLKNFGFVFQDYALIPELTAWENVALPALMFGRDKKTAKSEALEIMKFLDLDHRAENLPSQLSGGEQQRISVARAIARKPKILFADEPTASLDSERSEEVMNALLKLNDQGQTIVMVTHEPEYAMMTKRLIELRDGKIVSDKKLK